MLYVTQALNHEVFLKEWPVLLVYPSCDLVHCAESFHFSRRNGNGYPVWLRTLQNALQEYFTTIKINVFGKIYIFIKERNMADLGFLAIYHKQQCWQKWFKELKNHWPSRSLGAVLENQMRWSCVLIYSCLTFGGVQYRSRICVHLSSESFCPLVKCTHWRGHNHEIDRVCLTLSEINSILSHLSH